MLSDNLSFMRSFTIRLGGRKSPKDTGLKEIQKLAKSGNITTDNTISIDNIYSFSRYSEQDTVEGGISLTYGSEYSIFDEKKSDVLVYADTTLNLIDGSSVWIQSVSISLAEQGRNVVVLTKDNLTSTLLSEKMEAHPNITIIEPKEFGINRMISNEIAVKLIDTIDSCHGGFRAIICRGLKLSLCIRKYGQFRKRVFFYISDFYDIHNGTRSIKEDFTNNVSDLEAFARGFLCQTPEIGDAYSKIGISSERIHYLPPIVLDSGSKNLNKRNQNNQDVLRIGYFGKFSQDWGIYELLEVCKNIRKERVNLELHLVGDKFNKGTGEYSNFIPDMKSTFTEKEWIVWHGAKSRDESLEIMGEMDISWCYRPSRLEDNTLELSTKILETIVLDIPLIAYSSEINRRLLGEKSRFLFPNTERIAEAVRVAIGGRPIIERSERTTIFDPDKSLKAKRFVDLRGQV